MLREQITGKDNCLIAEVVYGNHNDNSKSKTEFVTTPDRSIQFGVLHRAAGTLIPSHQHLPTQKIVTGCQEVLIVMSGVIIVTIYDLDKTELHRITLHTRDVFIQYCGGHAFQFVHDTQFIELKQGPFTPADKVYFNPLKHEQIK